MASQQPSRQPTRSRHLRTPSAPVHTQQQQQQQPPRLRPTFNALQQHYSPAKSSTAPKPLTSTYLAPASPSKRPANVAASAETGRLQAELLQLHLLHRDACAVDAEWRESARQKLGETFGELGARSRELREGERSGLEAENVEALRRWGTAGGGGGGATGLEERLQVLDGVVSGTWSLSEPGGRFARLARKFERWAERVREMEQARATQAGGAGGQGQALFIGELDDSWKDECAGVARRLDAWRAQLRDIGAAGASGGDDMDAGEEEESSSSLARMLSGAGALVEGMRMEVTMMEEMEQEVLEREDEWIAEMSGRDDDGGGEDAIGAGAIWRTVG